PLIATRGGFYESAEVMDLINVVRLLDNPLQDFPLLGVLRSPMVGLSLDELAEIRLANRNGPFWTALVRWHEIETGKSTRPNCFERIDSFLTSFYRWRRFTRQWPVSKCLEAVLDETHYIAWLHLQKRG